MADKNKQKNMMFSGRLIKSNGKLVYTFAIQETQYKQFVDEMEEGQVVGIFLDAHKDTGTLDQLAKIHKCIREIAIETGTSVSEIKRWVKDKSGLIIHPDVEPESFADCSAEELGLVIQTIIEIGDLLNMQLR